MREEWWLEESGVCWLVKGWRPDGTQWCRPASDIEISLWARWKHADRELAILYERLKEPRTALAMDENF